MGCLLVQDALACWTRGQASKVGSLWQQGQKRVCRGLPFSGLGVCGSQLLSPTRGRSAGSVGMKGSRQKAVRSKQSACGNQPSPARGARGEGSNLKRQLNSGTVGMALVDSIDLAYRRAEGSGREHC